MAGTIWTKFYWSDWLSDQQLARCSLAAQGLWMRLLCIAAAGDPIGYVADGRVPYGLEDIARLAGVSKAEAEALVGELDRYGVTSRDRNGTLYSRRMVRDWKASQIARKNGKSGGNPNLRKQEGIPPPDNPSVKANDKGGLKTHMPEARREGPIKGPSLEASPLGVGARDAPDGLLGGKPPPGATGEPEPKRPPARVFVAFDTPPWAAWSAYRRSIGKTPFAPDSRHNDANGWWFPSEWPPGHERQMAAE